MTTSSIIQTKGHTEAEFEELAKVTDTFALKQEGLSIKIKAKWWGFTIELNTSAVKGLDRCLNYLEEEFGHHFKETRIRRAISLYIQWKQDRLINAVDATGSEGFVRMVSPWVIPFALVVVRGQMKEEDQNLWFTVWDGNTNTWGEDAEFNECMTRNAPALAQHGEFLYCVHRGCNNDNQLWWTAYSTNNGWSDDTVFKTNNNSNNHRTDFNPSLVNFMETLYCFHRGVEGDHALYYCTFDAEQFSWNDDVKIKREEDFFFSDNGCAVAVYKDELHLVYQINNSRNLKHICFNGKVWNIIFDPIPKCETNDTPALVAYKDKLLMVHRGHDDDFLWYNNYDGQTWSGDQKIMNGDSDACSKYGPGLAVFNDKVFMVHRGTDRADYLLLHPYVSQDKNLWYSIYDGSGWTKDTMADANNGIWTGAPPALACYSDPQCTSDNYVNPNVLEDGTVLPTTYQPRLICVHRGWGK